MQDLFGAVVGGADEIGRTLSETWSCSTSPKSRARLRPALRAAASITFISAERAWLRLVCCAARLDRQSSRPDFCKVQGRGVLDARLRGHDR